MFLNIERAKLNSSQVTEKRKVITAKILASCNELPEHHGGQSIKEIFLRNPPQ